MLLSNSNLIRIAESHLRPITLILILSRKVFGRKWTCRLSRLRGSSLRRITWWWRITQYKRHSQMSYFATKTEQSKSSDWLSFRWQHTETVSAQTCMISKQRQESEAVHQTMNKLRSSTTHLTSTHSFGTEIPTDCSIMSSNTSSVPTLQPLGAHNWREIIISSSV